MPRGTSVQVLISRRLPGRIGVSEESGRCSPLGGRGGYLLLGTRRGPCLVLVLRVGEWVVDFVMVEPF